MEAKMSETEEEIRSQAITKPSVSFKYSGNKIQTTSGALFLLHIQS